MADPIASTVTIRRPLWGRVVGYLSLASWVGSLCAEQLLRLVGPGAHSALVGPFALSGLALAGLALWLRVGLGRRGSLEAIVGPDGATLQLQRGAGRESLPASAVASGHVVPGRPASVALRLRDGREVIAGAPSTERAERLLEELGVDAARRACRVPVTSLGRRIATGVLTGFGVTCAGLLALMAAYFGLGGPKPIPPGLLLAWLMAQTVGTWLAVAATRPTEVVVGVDGVELRRSLGRRTYLAYADLERVELGPKGLLFRMKSGAVEAVKRVAGDALEAILLRVHEARAARETDPLADAKLQLLGRRGRDLSQWRSDLQRALTGIGGYRQTPLTEADLETVLAGGAEREATLGAALALAETGRPDRVRVAAERTADPRLRVALEGVAKGELDEDALEEALAEPSAREAPTLAR